MEPQSMTLEPRYNEQLNLQRVQLLGRVVNENNYGRFKEMVRTCIKHGVVDITGWNVYAVDALLSVCLQNKLTLSLKRDMRYFMLSLNPKASNIPLVAKAICEGEI
jgi:hypothetical protein